MFYQRYAPDKAGHVVDNFDKYGIAIWGQLLRKYGQQQVAEYLHGLPGFAAGAPAPVPAPTAPFGGQGAFASPPGGAFGAAPGGGFGGAPQGAFGAAAGGFGGQGFGQGANPLVASAGGMFGTPPPSGAGAVFQRPGGLFGR